VSDRHRLDRLLDQQREEPRLISMLALAPQVITALALA